MDRAEAKVKVLAEVTSGRGKKALTIAATLRLANEGKTNFVQDILLELQSEGLIYPQSTGWKAK